ncbi:MAG: thymidylate synthase, flavin-dependent [Candidatus Glassbacteria bacterium RBG_16_58_8]|uniref:Flavin-dependent thymidylate synthase n=1 Tax=Candidatus Glassbacteria bacterium RBG_16_58_8 TaxID=1817866 RepID=A0A1F5Y9T5_9BACT|nr:MAG: thymidylate synthase, flavin-dependent [Candidatus Glassbacteria bacterium RBG_16_58_8]
MKVSLIAITPDVEKVIEDAGRTCYLSHDKMTAESHERFIKMLVGKQHDSVLEHAYATFRIEGGSRCFTHQFVRHRFCSFSQQSQRYVDEEKFAVVTPDSIRGNLEALGLYTKFVEDAREAYRGLIALGIQKQDARFVLPNAVESEIVVSANFREWRHIFRARCHPAAQWEIRTICLEMLRILKKEAPSVFHDFVIDEEKKFAQNLKIVV